MAVLKTTSPERSAGAPKLLPSKTDPSSRARIAESNSSSSWVWGKSHCSEWVLMVGSCAGERVSCGSVILAGDLRDRPAWHGHEGPLIGKTPEGEPGQQP